MIRNAERFWAKVAASPDGDCWLWTGYTTSAGYGLVSNASKLEGVHRLTYEELRAPIPPGLVIDHLCRVRNCVNPWHLEPVTQQVNVQRSQSHIEWPATCPQGHEFTAANTHTTPRGHRRCRECNRQRARQNHAKRKAA